MNVKIKFMEALSNLNTFAKILTEKGYTGDFHTQGAYPGKLKDSITNYLENCRSGNVTHAKPLLLISGLLLWNGEGKAHVECNLWVKYLNGKFFLNKMEIKRKNRFGKLLKQSDLVNLSVITAPHVNKAIAMVSDKKKKKVVAKKGISGPKNSKQLVYEKVKHKN